MAIPSIPTFNGLTFANVTNPFSSAGGGGAPLGPSGYDALIALDPAHLFYGTETAVYAVDGVTPAVDGDNIKFAVNDGRAVDYITPYSTNTSWMKMFKRPYGFAAELLTGFSTLQSLANNDTGAGWVKGLSTKHISLLLQQSSAGATSANAFMRIGADTLSVGTNNGHYFKFISASNSLIIQQGDGSDYTYIHSGEWIVVQVIDDGVNSRYFIDNVEVASGKPRCTYVNNNITVGNTSLGNVAGIYVNDDPSTREDVYDIFAALKATL